MNLNNLRNVIKRLINEIRYEDVKDVQQKHGSTHAIYTGTVDEQSMYIKFSEPWNFDDDVDPSLQILVEYLAYKLYSLYKNVKIPTQIELVYDFKRKKVGIATSAISGSSALPNFSPKKLGEGLSAGVYVDIFLANWDAVGTDTGNVIHSDEDKTFVRIDPGGSLTFRAQGGRKHSKFGVDAGELKTMLDPKFSAGQVFKHSNLKLAAETFLSVDWSEVDSMIEEVHQEILIELQDDEDMAMLASQWSTDVDEIRGKLKQRWGVVRRHAQRQLG
jgi:hypothetical protein